MPIPLFDPHPSHKPITSDEITALIVVLTLAEQDADAAIKAVRKDNDLPEFQQRLVVRRLIMMRDEFQNLILAADHYNEPVSLLASRICPVCDGLLYSSGWCPVCNG